jgi:hypothetical protein
MKHILPVTVARPDRRHEPARKGTKIPGATAGSNYPSSNWSGLAILESGSSPFGANGSFAYYVSQFPSSAPPTTGCNTCGMAAWVGFGGSGLDSSEYLTQAGFEVYFPTASSSAELAAFYEQFPQQAEQYVSNFTFSPGERLLPLAPAAPVVVAGAAGIG